MLDGRVALVTGAARGLGRSHCLELARNGAAVVACDLDEPGGDDLARTVSDAESEGGTAVAVYGSVASSADVDAVLEEAGRRFGRLDVVVNNAGILRDRMLTAMTEREFDDVISVHLKGTWLLTTRAAQYWRAQQKEGATPAARIINTTSGTGLFGNIGQANYGAAKAGIANLTMISAMELSRYGITVNAISPIARTRMTEALPSMQAAAQQEGRPDRYDPIHASKVVAWLSSEQSGWLTGAVLRVDGASVYRVEPWRIDPTVAYHGGESIDLTRLDGAFRAGYGIFPGGMPSGAITSR